MKKYMIKEIFGKTIQGEGTHAGKVVQFLRFSGCNKWSGRDEDRKKSICQFCDTDFVGGKAMFPSEIIEKLKANRCKTVVISGGEPLLQVDRELLWFLTNSGFDLHLETNGSKSLGDLKNFFKHVTCSPKQTLQNTKLEECDDLKILYPPIAHGIAPDNFLSYKYKQGFLQPVTPHGEDVSINLKLTIGKLYNLTKWKLSLQLHKIIGVE